jgi:hypothetical protein
LTLTPADGHVTACGPTACVDFTSLQPALDWASLRPAEPVTIEVGKGVFASKSAGAETETVEGMLNWRDLDPAKKECARKNKSVNLTAFHLRGRTVATTVKGSSKIPSDVVIWGKAPATIVNHARSCLSNPPTASGTNGCTTYAMMPAFHALTVSDTTGLVTLKDLTIVSDGGLIDNGVDDASLNIVESRVHASNVIVAANKRSSNPLFNSTLSAELDQEGIAVNGESAELEIRDSLLGGNFHTGIMAEDGASVWAVGNLVRGNGWGASFAAKAAGHGITSFHYDCENMKGTNRIRAWNNIIMNNSGNGVLLRGSPDMGQGLVNNVISHNFRHGIALGDNWIGTPPLTLDRVIVFIANNEILGHDVLRGTEYDHSTGIYINDSELVLLNGGKVVITANNFHYNLRNMGPSTAFPHTKGHDVDPYLDASFQLQSSSPAELRGSGWTNTAHGPDISCYDSPNQDSNFKSTTLALWSQLIDVVLPKLN